MVSESTHKSIVRNRVLSIDFFRGLTMFLLIAEFTTLFEQMTDPALAGTWLHYLGGQFHHHPWHGLRFWDLIQPFFMFIVGVALPFSVENRQNKGQSSSQIRWHAFQRSFLLLVLGWSLYCIGPGQITFRFQNVLAQLGVTYLIAFLIMHRSVRFQFVVSLLLILATELIYRNFWVEEYSQAFVINENFGTWLDLRYNGADLNGGWVSFNAIPTAAHTIWGVLAGMLLKSKKEPREKFFILLFTGIIGILVGYILDLQTPIIKRICTSSFIIVSGGWTILALGICYWMIDILKWTKGVRFFAIVGMNPLFIYLFAHLGGAEFLRNIVSPFSSALFDGFGALFSAALTSIIVLGFLWYLCHWLYKRNIFIRI